MRRTLFSEVKLPVAVTGLRSLLRTQVDPIQLWAELGHSAPAEGQVTNPDSRQSPMELLQFYYSRQLAPLFPEPAVLSLRTKTFPSLAFVSRLKTVEGAMLPCRHHC